MDPQKPEPVKLFHGILYSDKDILDLAMEKLSGKFSPIDYTSSVFPFEVSGYYRAEMGSPVFRVFISHELLIQPNELAGIKIATNRIEKQLALKGKRKVNIDSGYMDVNKAVLASAKYNGQKIYLDFGIYADLTLYYEKGKFYHYPWSFPDFRSGEYNQTFLKIRERYKVQHKTWFFKTNR